MTIGRHGPLTCDEARRRAKALLGAVAAGRDPAAEVSAKREGETVDTLAKRYLHEHAEPKKKPTSVANDRRLFDVHVLPKLGRFRVADVTRREAAALHHSLAATPYASRRGFRGGGAASYTDNLAPGSRESLRRMATSRSAFASR